MNEEVAYTELPNVLGRGLVSDRDSSIIEIQIESLQKEINNLGEEAHRLLDRIKPASCMSTYQITRKRIYSHIEDTLKKDLAPEHASDMALRLAQISQQANHITFLIRTSIDELEL